MKRWATQLMMILVMVGVWGVIVTAQGGHIHHVQWGDSLLSIAAMYDVTPAEIMTANGLDNPDFIYIGQKLTIPTTQATQPHQNNGYYTVKAGDTLASIAANLNTTAQALASANDLSDVDFIYVGQVLNVPGGVHYDDDYQPPHSPQPNPSTYECVKRYTVEWGDSLSSIAWNYGLTINDITKANHLYGDAIYKGQVLCIPGKYSPPPAQPGHWSHIVKAGETVTGIAHQYGVSYAALIQANNLANNGLIYPGQKLVIPGAKGDHRDDDWQKKPYPNKDKDKDKDKPKNDTPPAPDYIEHDFSMEGGSGDGCFNPSERAAWGDIVVRAAERWCAQYGLVTDPDGLTTLVLRTVGESGAEFRIKGPNGVYYARTGQSGNVSSDAVYLTTAPGDYEITVEGESSETIYLTLPSGQRGWLDFSKVSVSEDPRPRAENGWSGRVIWNNSGVTPANGVGSVIIIHGGAKGLPIHMNIGDVHCYTGTKPEYGEDACEFGGLWPGKYVLTLQGTGVSVEVYVDGLGTAEIMFDHK